MPLDSRKTTHIQSVVNKTHASRQKQVVFTYQSGASYSYIAISVIFRPQQVIDPQIPDLAGNAPKLEYDMVMIAPLGTNFTGLVYIADTVTATAPAVASAAKYEAIQIVPTGIVPGGTHTQALLRRIR